MSESTNLDNAFWQFSLGTYAKPGVSALCIELQDTENIDVNLLLWCLWLDRKHIALSDKELADVDQRLALWRTTIIEPIRRLRRDIKQSLLTILTNKACVSSNDSYLALKDAELKAEQEQQAMLFSMSEALDKSINKNAQNTENYFKYLNIDANKRTTYLNDLTRLTL